MQCSRCGQDNPPQAKFCAKCGQPVSAPPPPVPPGPPPPPPGGSHAITDPRPAGNLVYPSNPPPNPNLAWINIIIPGLSQILMGQTVKGVVLLIASLSLSLVVIGVLIWIVSIIDGYMVGKVLQSGRPVGEWQFFPS
jgi:hypothetical protein